MHDGGVGDGNVSNHADASAVDGGAMAAAATMPAALSSLGSGAAPASSSYALPSSKGSGETSNEQTVAAEPIHDPLLHRYSTTTTSNSHSQQRQQPQPSQGKLSHSTSTAPAAGAASQHVQRTADDFDIFHHDDDDDATAAVRHTGKQKSNNNNNDKDDDDDDTASVDSYGLPRYQPVYPNLYAGACDGSSSMGGSGGGGGGGYDAPPPVSATVPWQVRKAQRRVRFDYFDFLLAPQFWEQAEFAARITAFAILVPSVILAVDPPGNPFVSRFMPFSSSVLAAKTNVGESIAYLLTYIRAGCIWLPLSVIAGALNLGNHIIGWCFYYTIIIFFMAVFTEHVSHRICLLLFNTSMVGLLVDRSRRELFPCRVMVDWSIGTGLCIAAAFIPFPHFCKREAQRLLGDIGKNTGTAFRGLVYSFWSPSNVERNMAMSKVRVMIDSLDHLMPAFEARQAFSLYEFLFESSEVRELRDVKYRFFEQIRINLSSMNRVLDLVEATPDAIDTSDRSQAFGELLMPHINGVGEAFDRLMEELSRAHTQKRILALQPSFDALFEHTSRLQEAYLHARRMLFYEHTLATLEEFVPLMTFYIFTLVCFRDTVAEFHTAVRRYRPSSVRTLRVIFWKVAGDPFMESVAFVQRLYRLRNRRELQRLVEAVKISGAMILTVGFTYLIKVQWSSFTGPNIIAFITGSNPVEAVQASIVRLTGCLIGTVLGFFASTYSVTKVQRVASLCTLMFCGTFLRNDKEYGIMSVYGMFVLIPLDTVVATTIDDTVQRMNQNTFGIFFYIIISASILPLSPSTILRLKRINLLRRMGNALQKMMCLFAAAPPSEVAVGGGGGGGCYSNLPSVQRQRLKPPPPPSSSLVAASSGTARTGNASAYAPLQHDSDEERMLDAGATRPTDLDGLGSDMGSSSSGGGDQAAVPPPVRNRSLVMQPGRDMLLEELDTMLADVSRRLKATKPYVDFAKNERTLLEKDYPTRNCSETYTHMYRMTILLRTMWLSWSVIRSQRHFTPGTRHMLRSLWPIANDVLCAFSRFVYLLTYMMDDPMVNLEGDVMKAVLDFIAASKELHRRKTQIILMLINSSVAAYRKQHGDVTTAPQLHELADAPVAAVAAVVARDDATRSTSATRRAVSTAAATTTTAAAARHVSSLPSSPGLARASTFDASTFAQHYSAHNGHGSTSAAGGGGASGTRRHGMLHVASADRNVTVLPYLRHQSMQFYEDTPTEPVHLPERFRFPVTSSDVEGLHSFTLCLVMFANEAKMLMMSIGAMIDFQRSKR